MGHTHRFEELYMSGLPYKHGYQVMRFESMLKCGRGLEIRDFPSMSYE
jgi:hypothetical protein